MKLLTIALAALLGAAFVAPAPAHAVDFAAVLTDADGGPAKICIEQDTSDRNKCAREVPLTLGHVARSALFATFQDEQNLAGEEKYKRAELAYGLKGAADVKMKAEDVALIKKLVAKLYTPLVVYQAWQLLEK